MKKREKPFLGHFSYFTSLPLYLSTPLSLSLNLGNFDAAVHRLHLDLVLAVVDPAVHGAADQVAVDLDAEIVADRAVDGAPLDREGRLTVELDLNGAVDRFGLQVAVQQGFLGDFDGAVDGLEGRGDEPADELDLAVHRLENQVPEDARALDRAVDRLELGPGQLFGDRDGEFDLGPGIALLVLHLDLQLVARQVEDDVDVLNFPFMIGLLDGLDLDAAALAGGDVDLAVDVRQLQRARGGQGEGLVDLLLIGSRIQAGESQ